MNSAQVLPTSYQQEKRELSTGYQQAINRLLTRYAQDEWRDTPPSEGRRSASIYVSRKKKLLKNKKWNMIRIVTDEEVHEMDIELIELFAVYLFDRDQVGMADLIYIVEDRMSDDYLETEKQQHSLV